MGWVVLGVARAAVPLGAGSPAHLDTLARTHYLDHIVRIFQEKPLFIIPRGKPTPTPRTCVGGDGGVKLRGCYLRHGRRNAAASSSSASSSARTAGRAGRTSSICGPPGTTCSPASRATRATATQTRYEPLQWVTDRDLADCRAALEYLNHRPDADPRGVGLFGFSKGGSAGLVVAADDRYVRCVVTDGAFGAYTTMVPYMREWFGIYDPQTSCTACSAPWYYGLIARVGVARSAGSTMSSSGRRALPAGWRRGRG